MKKQPGGNAKSGGFISSSKDFIRIDSLKLLQDRHN